MNFYDILFQQQNAEKVPYSKSYFDTLFAQKFSNIKTMTGTLPLTFTTSETKLRSWTIYGADIEHEKTATGKSISFYTDEDKLRDWTIYGNDSVGKNIFEIIPADQIIAETGTLKFITDAEAGTITANGTAGSAGASVKQRFTVNSELAGNYYYSASFNQTGSASTFDAYMYDNTAHAFITKWDGTTRTPSIYGTESQEVKLIEGHAVELTIRVFKNTSVDNLIFKPMLRAADTFADFEPYQIGIGQRTNNGYIVPLSVNGNTVNIPIGNAPLTEGQSVSKTSTGVDIATTDGNNTITTSLYNQPDMSITYNEFTGVGMLTANLFMIALQVKAGGSFVSAFSILLNKPLRAGETLTSEQTGETIQTVAGVENKLTPSPNAASYGGSFDMTIKYKE